MFKVLTAIVTYKPVFKDVTNVISKLINESNILIVDNSPKKFDIHDLNTIEGITIIRNYNIGGIAKALNLAIDFALSHNFDFLFTLDQDSEPKEGIVTGLLGSITDKSAIICPKIVNYNEDPYSEINTDEYLDYTITSGSLLNLEIIINEHFRFFEKFFIDYVDFDFCLRIRKAGYSIIRNNKVELLHHLGDLKIKNILNKEIKITNHSSSRYYYRTRNRVYMWKHTELYLNNFIYRDFIRFITDTIKVIFFEENKFSKIKAIHYGLIHGITNNFDFSRINDL